MVRRYVIWSRIDQKACVKAIFTAGMQPIVVDTLLGSNGDQLETDEDGIRTAIKGCDREELLCVITTTSCFAPRGCDKVDVVAQICEEYDVPHVINNAYGVQASKLTHEVNEAIRIGRVDAIVQSTDKNFCVPVGGSIVASANEELITKVSQVYPGRASSSPIVDLFITLLSLGKEGWKELRESRKTLMASFREQVGNVVEKRGQRVLSSPQNPISVGFTLNSSLTTEECTEFGSKLFHRGISGSRVIAQGSDKKIGNITFGNWGCNSGSYHTNYVTCACALGITSSDIELFCQRLDKALANLRKPVE